jgi:hypothetical protein
MVEDSGSADHAVVSERSLKREKTLKFDWSVNSWHAIAPNETE